MAWSTGILNGTLYVTDYRLNSESLYESRSPEARIASSCFPYDAFIDVSSTVAYVILVILSCHNLAILNYIAHAALATLVCY